MSPTLRNPSLWREAALIDGIWGPARSGRTLDVDNPSSGDVIGTVPDCDGIDTQVAIEAAERALPAWRARTAQDRAAVLMRWFDLMIDHQDDLARIMTAEQGKPWGESRGEILYAASFLKWFAEEGVRASGSILPAPSADRRILVTRQAVGVTAAITPWNFPAAMITRKCAPALAAGCTMIIKPSDLTPFTALAIMVLAQEAGVPDGVLNIVTGQAAPIGDALTGSAIVRKISFTGSTRVGALLMEKSAPSIKRLSLELGGNAPLIVFDDATLADAVSGAMASKFRNAGQTCVCANRVLVQDGIYERFVAAVTEAIAALRVGDGMDDTTTIGPLINTAAVAKVSAHIADAVEKGAQHVAIPCDVPASARFAAPTLLTGVTADMRIMNEETFGPVMPISRFKTEAEAIALANATPFGLAAYAFTNDLNRTLRLSEALEFGMVGINTGAISTEVAPFGGVKQSGLGREGGPLGLDEYLETKAVHIASIRPAEDISA